MTETRKTTEVDNKRDIPEDGEIRDQCLDGDKSCMLRESNTTTIM